MAKDGSNSEIRGKEENCEVRSNKSKSKRKYHDSSSSFDSSDSEDGKHRSSRRNKKTKKRNSRRSSRFDESPSSSSYSDSELDSASDDSESEAERRKRKRKREKEKRKEKEKRREKEKLRKEKKKKKEKKKEKGTKGAVTNSWGKYGIIRETDMWNKRPEFTAWLLEVKQVNLETLANWEEKQMFKEFMEDHNTATFPSKKYYNLDAYHARKMEKELKKGLKKVTNAERTVFNDEEQRRLELQRAREKQKEEEIEALKRSMQGGMAQAMKEQARLREEMAYQYRIGNHEAAAAIQRRLDPDVAM